MFGGGGAGKKYTLTATASFRNVLNHPNYANPSGDLFAVLRGIPQYRQLRQFGAATTYNRKIDLQLRLAF